MSINKILGLVVLFVVSIYGQNCDSGTYLDGTQCRPCDNRCAVCASINFCTVCQTQAYLTIVEGDLICKLCKQIFPGCAICQSQNSCSICLDGYYLDSTGCVQTPSNGGQITLENQLICQSFEINLNGVCHPSIALCKNYASDATCNQCEDNSLLIQGYCIPQHIASNAINIQSNQNNQHAGLVCQQRQYIQNGECVTIGEQCQEFMLNGSCTKCKDGFIVYNGLCLQEPSANNNILVSYIPVNQNASEYSNLNSEPSPQDRQSQSPHQQQTPQNSTASQCHFPCETCSEDSQYCLTCEHGYTTVDQMPGKCFKQ